MTSAQAVNLWRTTRACSQEIVGDEELIKCVVVGDCGVGKTKLVCARACGTHYTLTDLVTQSRAPTVWAIDHYATDKQVAEQSRCIIDGTPVHIRLWDTFGYHDMDRMFAYDGADVVLLCFSLVRPNSLRNVHAVWYPEVLRLCPGVPILLVGCQADLRYLHKDKSFRSMDKSSLFSNIASEDVIYPNDGRSVAKLLDAPYYETSVLSSFGVSCTFDNALRVALLRRGNGLLGQHFKHVRPAQPQAPECPWKPEPPLVTASESAVETDLSQMLSTDGSAFSDVTFLCHGFRFDCHRVIVCAGCPVLKDVLATKMPADMSLRGKLTCLPSLDRASLLGEMELEENDDTVLCKDVASSVFRAIWLCTAKSQRQSASDGTCSGSRTVVAVDDSITRDTFANFLHFLYTGVVCTTYAANRGSCYEVVQLAQLAYQLHMPELALMCSKLALDVVSTTAIGALDFVAPLDADSKTVLSRRSDEFLIRRAACLRDIGLRDRLYTDIVFQLEDGNVSGHRALLAAHCDVMKAMFFSSFKDSASPCVRVCDINVATCAAFLDVLYTGQCSLDMKPNGYVDLIVLANRLCLPAIVAAAEKACVQKLTEMALLGRDTTLAALTILETAQLHNAPQLAEWCFYHVSVNYVLCFNRHKAALCELSPDNQEQVVHARWPPLWYLLEQDNFEKLQRAAACASLAALDFTTAGCLCFGTKHRKQSRHSQLFSHDEAAAVGV